MLHVDLFSGIGGFSLGFEREGFRPIAFVEIDDGCRAILGQNWPEVSLYKDINDYSGFPVSGSFSGRQTCRFVRLSELADVQPTWLVVENTHHLWRAWVPELRSQLHALGYASLCVQVSASEVGAHHERRRAFVIAHADSEQLRELSRWWSWKGRQVADELAESWDYAPRGLGADDGLPNWVDRRHAIGNAVVPQVAQLIAVAINAVSEEASHE